LQRIFLAKVIKNFVFLPYSHHFYLYLLMRGKAMF